MALVYGDQRLRHGFFSSHSFSPQASLSSLNSPPETVKTRDNLRAEPSTSPEAIPSPGLGSVDNAPKVAELNSLLTKFSKEHYGSFTNELSGLNPQTAEALVQEFNLTKARPSLIDGEFILQWPSKGHQEPITAIVSMFHRWGSDNGRGIHVVEAARIYASHKGIGGHLDMAEPDILIYGSKDSFDEGENPSLAVEVAYTTTINTARLKARSYLSKYLSDPPILRVIILDIRRTGNNKDVTAVFLEHWERWAFDSVITPRTRTIPEEKFREYKGAVTLSVDVEMDNVLSAPGAPATHSYERLVKVADKNEQEVWNSICIAMTRRQRIFPPSPSDASEGPDSALRVEAESILGATLGGDEDDTPPDLLMDAKVLQARIIAGHRAHHLDLHKLEVSPKHEKPRTVDAAKFASFLRKSKTAEEFQRREAKRRKLNPGSTTG